MGILLPIMGSQGGIPLPLFGRTRQVLLGLLYTRVDEPQLQENLIQLAAAGRGAVQRELDFLAKAGVIRRSVRGRQVYFQANSASPVFGELRGLILKTAGLGDVLRAALAPLAQRIRAAFVYGSMAAGRENRASDIDVMIIGEVSFAQVADALGPAQQTLGREVNPTVYPPDEWRAKLKAKSHFARSVMKGEKIFLLGDERELARLAKK